jgi:thymidine kinase
MIKLHASTLMLICQVYTTIIWCDANQLPLCKRPKRGSLTVICGSMASGKSDEFIRTCSRLKIANPDNILILKHALDKRKVHDGIDNPLSYVSSRSGSSIACIAIGSVEELEAIAQNPQYDIVAIDETQFFEKDKLLACVHRLLNQGKKVITAGLDLDFRGETFGAMGDLLARADEVYKLKAICEVCKQDTFCISQRTIDRKPADYNDETIMPGLVEYTPRCASCHIVTHNKK